MADHITAQVRDVLAAPVAAAGVELEDVTVHRAGRRRVVRVSVDTDAGITLDQVAEVTRVVSAALDADEVMGDAPYTLEVGSPGVSRPLTVPRHWRRNIGRRVRVVPADGTAPFDARIESVADDGTVVLAVGAERREVRQDDVERAVVQVDLKGGEA